MGYLTTLSPLKRSFFNTYDISVGRVDDLAAELGKSMTSIAIGSEEGFTQADKAINTASKNGRWVLLKNVHLAPSWLVTLEKKLHSMSVHSAFRLFLTCEITPKVCQNYLRSNISNSHLKIALQQCLGNWHFRSYFTPYFVCL